MQIDVLSQNTLKLTLSRLDMFDMDIKYESLSGRNPDTKRLLSHVLRTVKLDKSSGVDFSGERLFVEAFPRPDGGCMLYISCLTEDRERLHSFVPEKKSVKLTAKTPSKDKAFPKDLFKDLGKSKDFDKSKDLDKSIVKMRGKSENLLCRLACVNDLDRLCKNLLWCKMNFDICFTSTLYCGFDEYRLFINSDSKKRICAVVSEFGELLGEEDLSFTNEHYNLIAAENAVETMSSVL